MYFASYNVKHLCDTVSLGPTYPGLRLVFEDIAPKKALKLLDDAKYYDCVNTLILRHSLYSTEFTILFMCNCNLMENVYTA